MSDQASNHAPYLRCLEPFFYPGGETGCLCLHGFTASPAEVRWMGMYLRDCGYTVHGQRLAGHGTDPRYLARTTWRDWYASALDGYTLLRQACKRVVLVGHSMGGLLAPPPLLIYSRGDETAAVVQGHYIAAQVSSTVIERQVLDNSGHIITQDVEREQVFTWVADFVATVANSSAG